MKWISDTDYPSSTNDHKFIIGEQLSAAKMHPLVSDYQNILEDVLTWLLGAEETFQQIQDEDESRISNSSDIHKLKQVFHEHQQFMTEFTLYQKKIEELLREGQVLVDSDEMCSSPEEKIKIATQRDLLSSRWERLRLKVDQKESQLHEGLSLLQQKQLDNLKAWLISAEDKISHFGDVGPDLDSVKQQLGDHRQFQDEVIQQQEVVNSLSHMVVMEEGQSNGEATEDDLEDQLTALGEKWAHVCRFVEERGNVLELVANNWQLLKDEEANFNEWICKLEKRLNEMEESASQKEVGSQQIQELLRRLKKIEKEMEKQHIYYSKIADEGQRLLDHMDKSCQSVSDISRMLEGIAEVWDYTVQRVENLGMALTKASTIRSKTPRKQPLPSSSSAISATAIPEEKTDESKDDLPSPSTVGGEKHELPTPTFTSGVNKKRRIDTWRIKEWQNAAGKVSTWLGRTEGDLGLDDQEQGSVVWEDLEIEEQQILMEDIETSVEAHKQEVEDVISQGHQMTDELRSCKSISDLFHYHDHNATIGR